MRLLVLNHNYRFLGTFNRVMGLAIELAQRHHEVTVMTVSREHRWTTTWSEVDGVRLCECPNLGLEGYGPLDNLVRILHALRTRYDIVQMFDHKPNATFAGCLAGRFRGARLVSDWADWWGGPGGLNDTPSRRFPPVRKFEEWWEIKSKLLSDGVIAISTTLQQRAFDVGCPRDRVILVPNCGETKSIHTIPLAEARKHLGISPEQKIVGFFGMGQGDMEIAMDAIAELPGVLLMVIGPKTRKVLNMAQSFGIDTRLWQTDFVPEEELSWYLACPDIMCLPMNDRAANRGRLPGKLMYYMAAGRPTVASPVGDVKSIMETHKIGILAQDSGFASAINSLLENQVLCEELGRNSRGVAETVFDWKSHVDEVEEFYKRILG